jgi:hypothetical protein
MGKPLVHSKCVNMARMLRQKVDNASSFAASKDSTPWTARSSALLGNKAAAMASLTLPEALPMSTSVIYHVMSRANVQQPVDGVTITLPIEFVKENGVWKILEY